jgi:hypothetical protein
MKLSDASIVAWVKENNILTDAGKTLYFDKDRLFLKQPFMINHRRL